MKLIIDTSSEKLKCILLKEDETFDCGVEHTSHHQEHLLKEIELLLNKKNAEPSDIKEIGVVVGPGSFTGIRLAVATAKSFEIVNNTKIVAINMLNLLDFCLQNRNIAKPYYAFIKCTSTKTYVGKFGDKTDLFTIKNEDFDKIIDKKFSMFGYNINQINDTTLQTITPTNDDYVAFMLKEVKNSNFVSCDELEPLYMALSQAEEELAKREQKSE